MQINIQYHFKLKYIKQYKLRKELLNCIEEVVLKSAKVNTEKNYTCYLLTVLSGSQSTSNSINSIENVGDKQFPYWIWLNPFFILFSTD